MGTLPPASPAYIFRGHASAVHTVLFFRNNLRLLTGDAEGWIVIWDLPSRRAVAVWRAHGSELYSEDAVSKSKPDAEAENRASGKKKATVTDEDEEEEQVDEEVKSKVLEEAGREERLRGEEREEEEEEEDDDDDSAKKNSSTGSVLGACVWGDDTIVTHGRDGKLCVWAYASKDEANLSTVLPLDGDETEFDRRAPWLRHVLNVPTLNFCAFASCTAPAASTAKAPGSLADEAARDVGTEPRQASGGNDDNDSAGKADEQERNSLIVATPGMNESEIALFHLPSEKRIGLIRVPGELQQQQQSTGSTRPNALAGNKTGMVMALRLFLASPSGTSPEQVNETPPQQQQQKEERGRGRALVVLAGFENGQTVVFRSSLQQRQQQRQSWSTTAQESNASEANLQSAWHIVYTSRPHEQPILGLDVINIQSPLLSLSSASSKLIGSSSSSISYQARQEPSTSPSAATVAATATASEACTFFTSSVDATLAKHRFSTAVAAAAAAPAPASARESNNLKTQAPVLAKNTRHSAQQSLTVRSDGKILATAGWDARVRVYSTKTCNELAVLKWHRQSCYAVAFAPVKSPEEIAAADGEEQQQLQQRRLAEESEMNAQEKVALIRRSLMDMSTVERRRIEATKITHWLAAGSKDGKVSLWSIY